MSTKILISVLLLVIVSNLIETRRPSGTWSSQVHTSLSAKYFNSSSNPIVVINDGGLRGFTMKTISGRPIAAFQNIPFAQPPTGALRFKEPIKNLPWLGIRDALQESPDCVQIDKMRINKTIGQEDCLYLDVYTPRNSLFGASKPRGKLDDLANNQSLPVLLFLHGGRFFSGGGHLYGPRYLLEKNVILVVVSYRLGSLGFLSTGDDASPGNNGLKDQVAALKWVNENIRMFGGDPNAVTIFGQSAGAAALHYHIVSPLSKDLFHAAISQSALRVCWWEITENAPNLARGTGELFNCTGSSFEMVACLKGIDAHELFAAQQHFTEWRSFPIAIYGPVIEHDHTGAFLTQRPEKVYEQGKAARVPLITGYTRHEMSWIFADFLSDPTAAPELNKNWDTIGEFFLTIKNATGSNAEIATRIRDFYLGGDTEISFRNRHAITQMLGDRYFLPCWLDLMRYHSRYTDEPVYGYEFSFEGKYSVVESTGQNPAEWGVAHIDDLIYLLNSTEYYSTIDMWDTDEVAMSNIMTDIWSNFAKFGKPYISISGQLTDTWQPIARSANSSSPLQFLDLNLQPRMMSNNPFTERYNFWKSLRLTN